MRQFMLLCLTVLTLVTSVGLGHARGLLPAQDGLVVCSGHTTSVIWLDSHGNEVEVAVLCPEAALGLFAQASAVAPDAHPIALRVGVLVVAIVSQPPGIDAGHTPKARAPPLSV